MLNHPFFGIGQGEWVRPYWRGHPTIDNFWLAIAVRYGLPALVFLWFGIACNALAILLRTGLDPDEQRQRRGYLIALAGLLMILVTVSIWGPVSTFVLTYFGAGVWFYARDRPRLGPGSRAAGTAPRARRGGGSSRAPGPPAPARSGTTRLPGRARRKGAAPGRLMKRAAERIVRCNAPAYNTACGRRRRPGQAGMARRRRGCWRKGCSRPTGRSSTC